MANDDDDDDDDDDWVVSDRESILFEYPELLEIKLFFSLLGENLET